MTTNPIDIPPATSAPETETRAKLTPPILTPMEDRLQHIEAMGQRIHGHIQYMCQVAHLDGTSAEAKEKAVTAFHEKMIVVERQLGRIKDDLRLG